MAHLRNVVALTTKQSLQNKRVLSIDLASIMAGSGIRGQFEEKFKALLRDIEDEVCKLIYYRLKTPDDSTGRKCRMFH